MRLHMHYHFLKGFVSNFDFSDQDIVNIISKPYLLATLLSYFNIPFSYDIKCLGLFMF